MLETALNEEMTEHLGYEKHDPAGVGTGNIRNGTRAKTVLTTPPAPSNSMCHETGPRRLSRRSSRSVSGGYLASMRWCCRCMPKA